MGRTKIIVARTECKKKAKQICTVVSKVFTFVVNNVEV